MSTFKRLFPYMRPYKWPIGVTLFLGAIMASVGVSQATVVKQFIDQVLTNKNYAYIPTAVWLIVGVQFAAGIVRFGHMYLLRYTSDRICYDIRKDLQAHYAESSLDFHTGHSTGSLLSKAVNDITNIQIGLGLLADIVREPLTAVVLIGYALYVDWKLTLIIFLAAPLLILISRSFGRSVRKYAFEHQIVLDRITSLFKETLDGIRVIKAFSLEKHTGERFSKTVDEMLAIKRKVLSREEAAGPIFEFLAACVVAVILYIVGYQATKGRITPGGFVAYIAVLGMLQQPIKKLQDAHVRMQNSIISLQRIFDLLGTPISVKDPEESGRVSVPWNDQWQTIEFKNLHFSYGTKEILKGVNLKVNRGEVVAIVGSSGGGKTTLVNLIPRFYDVTSGQLCIGNTDVRDFNLQDLRSHIALVTQDVFLFNETIRENVAAGQNNPPENKIQNALGAANAAGFVTKLKDQDLSIVGDRGGLLSGGERQRISIARAVYKNTPILILDEATSSLDSESEKVVQEALEKLMVGRTTFVIAHRLSTVQKADRIVVLSDGKIIEEGRHEDLLTKQGAYFSFHKHQFS